MMQPTTRRTLLATTGALTTGIIAGCLGDSDDGSDDTSPWNEPVSSNIVTWDDLGDLEGDLTIYSGRTRDQIDPLFEQLEDRYDDFTVSIDQDDNDTMVTKLLEEGETPADIFYTQDSGALAVVKDEDILQPLPSDITEAIDEGRTDPDGDWMGVSGRVRAIQYNTDQWDDDLPTDIMEYAYDERFQDIISTRPNSGTFRAFIIAMMELEGEDATRDWVSAMVNEQNATLYSGGTAQANAVYSGEQPVALGNQYYAGRILTEDPDAPLDVAFTENDAGCLFNVSGIGITNDTNNASLAAEFARHLVAKEGQEFFVEVNGEYPVIDGVDYVGDLPTVEEINPPDFDLNQLGLELEAAVDLLREEGMRV